MKRYLITRLILSGLRRGLEITLPSAIPLPIGTTTTTDGSVSVVVAVIAL